MKTRLAAALCAVFMVASLLAGCGAGNREALKVNGTKITSGEFAFYLESMKQLIKQQLLAENPTLTLETDDDWATVDIENKKAIDMAKDKALDEASKITVQVQKANEAGIKLTDSDKASMNKQKSSIVQSYGGTDKFNALLSKCGLNQSGFDKILEKYFFASKLEEQTVSAPGFANYTDEQLKEMYARQTARVKHILVLFDKEDGTKRTDEQAKAEAQVLLDRARAGEDFDALVAQYSEDPGSKSQPEGYTMTEGDNQMVKEFTDASFALDVGDISDLVKTDYGYHIIKRYPIENFDQDFESAKSGLIQKLAYAQYDDQVEQWKNAAYIEKNDEVIASIK